jgi:hypothetical protein
MARLGVGVGEVGEWHRERLSAKSGLSVSIKTPTEGGLRQSSTVQCTPPAAHSRNDVLRHLSRAVNRDGQVQHLDCHCQLGLPCSYGTGSSHLWQRLVSNSTLGLLVDRARGRRKRAAYAPTAMRQGVHGPQLAAVPLTRLPLSSYPTSGLTSPRPGPRHPFQIVVKGLNAVYDSRNERLDVAVTGLWGWGGMGGQVSARTRGESGRMLNETHACARVATTGAAPAPPALPQLLHHRGPQLLRRRPLGVFGEQRPRPQQRGALRDGAEHARAVAADAQPASSLFR